MEKLIILVGIYNQQFQGTIFLMVFDFQGIYWFWKNGVSTLKEEEPEEPEEADPEQLEKASELWVILSPFLLEGRDDFLAPVFGGTCSSLVDFIFLGGNLLQFHVTFLASYRIRSPILRRDRTVLRDASFVWDMGGSTRGCR